MVCDLLALGLVMPILSVCNLVPDSTLGTGKLVLEELPLIECGTSLQCLVDAGRACRKAHGSFTLQMFGMAMASWDMTIKGCVGSDVLYHLDAQTAGGIGANVDCRYPKDLFGGQAFAPGGGAICTGTAAGIQLPG